MRTGWLRASDVVALAEYVRSIPLVANPYLAPDGRLSAAQARGRLLFERSATHDGRPIPRRDRCDVCHSGPDFTNQARFDVGTRAATDSDAEFDTAHLANVFESAPYPRRPSGDAGGADGHNRQDKRRASDPRRRSSTTWSST